MSKTKTYATIGENVGVGGYDPVSYFPEGGSKPQKGFVLRNHVHDGITYRFATDENLSRFKANPEKYLPLYGGWCAWAIGKLGKKVECDPTSYVIKDGKLYLFYNHAELDTRKDWLANEKELSQKAEENWNSSINQ
jgi:hypothetical protein